MSNISSSIPGIATLPNTSVEENFQSSDSFPRKPFSSEHYKTNISQDDLEKFTGQAIRARLRAIRARSDSDNSDGFSRQDGDFEEDEKSVFKIEGRDAKAYGMLKRVLAHQPDIDFQNLSPQLKEALKKLTRRGYIFEEAKLADLLSEVRLIGPADAPLDSSGITLSDSSSELLQKINSQSETIVRRIYHSLKRKGNLSTRSDVATLDKALLDDVFHYFKGGLLKSDLTFVPITTRLKEINGAGQYGVTIGQTIARMGQILAMSGRIHGAANIIETEKVAKNLNLITVKSYICPINHYNLAFYVQFMHNKQKSMETGFFTIVDEINQRVSFERQFSTYMSHQELDEQIASWEKLLTDLSAVTNPWSGPDYNDHYKVIDLAPGLLARVTRSLGMVLDYTTITIGEAKQRLESAVGFLLRFRKQNEIARLLSPLTLTGSLFLDCEFTLQKPLLSIDYGYDGECLYMVNSNEMTYSELLESPSDFSHLQNDEQIMVISRALMFAHYGEVAELLTKLSALPADRIRSAKPLSSAFSCQTFISGIISALIGNEIKWDDFQGLRAHSNLSTHALTLLSAELELHKIGQPEDWLTVKTTDKIFTYGEAMRSLINFQSLPQDDQLRVLAWGLQLGHFGPITALLLEKETASHTFDFSREKLERNLSSIKKLLGIGALTDYHIKQIAKIIREEHSIVSYQQFSEILGFHSSIFHQKTAFGKL